MVVNQVLVDQDMEDSQGLEVNLAVSVDPVMEALVDLVVKADSEVLVDMEAKVALEDREVSEDKEATVATNPSFLLNQRLIVEF